MPFYCQDDSCSNLLYMCQFPDCYTFICDKCIEKRDAYVYSKKLQEKRIICVDCLPNVAVNIHSGDIRICSSGGNKKQKNTETSSSGVSTSWINRSGFNPLSSKISVFAVAAAAAAAAAVSAI